MNKNELSDDQISAIGGTVRSGIEGDAEIYPLTFSINLYRPCKEMVPIYLTIKDSQLFIRVIDVVPIFFTSTLLAYDFISRFYTEVKNFSYPSMNLKSFFEYYKNAQDTYDSLEKIMSLISFIFVKARLMGIYDFVADESCFNQRQALLQNGIQKHLFKMLKTLTSDIFSHQNIDGNITRYFWPIMGSLLYPKERYSISKIREFLNKTKATIQDLEHCELETIDKGNILLHIFKFLPLDVQVRALMFGSTVVNILSAGKKEILSIYTKHQAREVEAFIQEVLNFKDSIKLVLTLKKE